MLTTIITAAELERQKHAATEIQRIARGRAARAKKKEDSEVLAIEKEAKAEVKQKEDVVQEAEAKQKEGVVQQAGEPSAQGLLLELKPITT